MLRCAPWKNRATSSVLSLHHHEQRRGLSSLSSSASFQKSLLNKAQLQHVETLQRRQEVCPHLFLLKGAGSYNGPPRDMAAANSSTSTSVAAGEGGDASSFSSPPPLASRIEQQCELCGKCRILDRKKILASLPTAASSSAASTTTAATGELSPASAHINRLFEKLQPTLPLNSAEEEEPWVDVSYNVHCALKAFDLHVGKEERTATTSVATTTSTDRVGSSADSTNDSASSSSTSSSPPSLVTKFLSSLTATISSKAMYKQAADRKKKRAEAAAATNSREPTKEEPTTAAAATACITPPATDVNDRSDCPYPLAEPKRTIITSLDLYSFVPRFKTIADHYPALPFTKPISTVPQAVKYFGSVSKKELMAKYLTCEVERELGCFDHESVDAEAKRRKRYDLFRHPEATLSTASALASDQSNSSPSPSSPSVLLSLPPSKGTQIVRNPSIDFVQSSLRAIKHCAAVYGTAYERHFFDSVLQVGRVRSFLEIYQSDHASQLAAARRTLCSDLDFIPRIWSHRHQKYLLNAPATEILDGNWTNLPWGVTHIVTVDHKNREIALAFRGTFADAGIIVDLHNGPLSLLSVAEEKRLGLNQREKEVVQNQQQEGEAKENGEGKEGNLSSSSSPSSSPSSTFDGKHCTAPFGFVYNIRPGSSQTRSIDKLLLKLLLIDYPSTVAFPSSPYKMVFTGHSLGAAYSTNFPLSRLMVAALAQQAGLYSNPKDNGKSGEAAVNQTVVGDADEARKPLWPKLRAIVLELDDLRLAGETNTSVKNDQCSDERRERIFALNRELEDIIDNQIDFSDPIQVSGAYMNGLIRRRRAGDADNGRGGVDGENPFSTSSSNDEFVSTIEERFVVNSFAPPASMNATWRDGINAYYPRLDCRSFVHDTDVVTRLQISTLRTMQETINNNDVLPSLFQRKVQSFFSQFVLGGGDGSTTSNCSKTEGSPQSKESADAAAEANATAIASEEAPVYTALHAHLQKEMADRRRILRDVSSASVGMIRRRRGVGGGGGATDNDNASGAVGCDDKTGDGNTTNGIGGSSSGSGRGGGSAFVADCPSEQLANLEDLQECFHERDFPRTETRDNFWVFGGRHVYLLGRRGQSYYEQPSCLSAPFRRADMDGEVGVDLHLRAVKTEDTINDDDVEKNKAFEGIVSDLLSSSQSAVDDEPVDCPWRNKPKKISSLILGAASNKSGEEKEAGGRKCPPPPLYDIPDSSFDIATAFNTIRRPSVLALIDNTNNSGSATAGENAATSTESKQPSLADRTSETAVVNGNDNDSSASSIAGVSNPGLVVPIVDMRAIHNHFLFRYGRAILDLHESTPAAK